MFDETQKIEVKLEKLEFRPKSEKIISALVQQQAEGENKNHYIKKAGGRLSRSKTAVSNASNKSKKSKEKDYQHKFYSKSWRIHSEFGFEEPDRNAIWDPTHTLFYCVGKKIPETFLFHPEWV